MIAESLLAEIQTTVLRSVSLRQQSLVLKIESLSIGAAVRSSRQSRADGEFIANHHAGISPYWRTDSNRKSDAPAEKEPDGGSQVIWLVPSGAPGVSLVETNADVTAEALGEGDDVELFLAAHGAPPAEDFELLDALDELCLYFPTTGE